MFGVGVVWFYCSKVILSGLILPSEAKQSKAERSAFLERKREINENALAIGNPSPGH